MTAERPGRLQAQGRAGGLPALPHLHRLRRRRRRRAGRPCWRAWASWSAPTSPAAAATTRRAGTCSPGEPADVRRPRPLLRRPGLRRRAGGRPARPRLPRRARQADRPDKRRPAAAARQPGRGAGVRGADATREPGGTTHFVIVDAAGNAVSMTTTVESIFGDGRMVDGFFLNNQLTDFSFEPEGPRRRAGRQRGRPAASGRARRWRRPSCWTGRAGCVAAVGSPGGPSILAYNLKALVATSTGRCRCRTRWRCRTSFPAVSPPWAKRPSCRKRCRTAWRREG